MRRLPLLLLCLLLTLTGCAGQSSSEIQPSDPSPDMVDVSEPPEDGAEPAPPLEPLDYSALAVEGAPGFYDLTSLPQLAGLTISEATPLDDSHMLFLSGAWGEEVRVLDLETGAVELLCTLSVAGEGDWSSTTILSADPLVIYDYSTSVCYLVEEDGTVSPLFSPADDSVDYWNAVYTDSGFLWYQWGSGSLLRCAMDSDTPELIGTLPPEYFFPSLMGLTLDESQAVFTATTSSDSTEVTLLVDLSTGDIAQIYLGSCAERFTGALTNLTEPLETSPLTYQLSVQSPEAVVSASFDLNLLAGEEQTLSADNSWMYCPSSEPLWGQNLYFAWTDDTFHLLLWDYRALTPEEREPQALTAYERPECDMGELSLRAEAIKDTYGIWVYLGDTVSALFPDYTLEPCEDTAAISSALDVLEEALSRYPTDYFEQLGGDSVRAICFYLSGRMTPIDPAVSIDDPGGLSCQLDSVEMIAFNINGNLRVQDVVHELTHVLDHWLWADGTLDESDWSALNPEDFDYHYAYIDEDGNSYEWGATRYTAWDAAYYSGDIDSIYFIDPYSTTYPTEDRARLMEYLLADPESGPPNYFSSVHLQEKLTYYFQCIRARFDTSQWPEQTSWEKALTQMAPEN